MKIEVKQNQLFDLVNNYFEKIGFFGDRELWCFSNDIVTINLYPDSINSFGYTLRPNFTVHYTTMIQKLKEVVQTNDFDLFNSGHFYLDNKLANVFNIVEFDSCEENNQNPFSPYFLFNVNFDDEMEMVSKRLVKIMQIFGWEAISSCLDLDKMYDLYKLIFSNYIIDFTEFPGKKSLERPYFLEINGLITMAYLGRQKNDNELSELIDQFKQIMKYRSYWVDPLDKIREAF